MIEIKYIILGIIAIFTLVVLIKIWTNEFPTISLKRLLIPSIVVLLHVFLPIFKINININIMKYVMASMGILITIMALDLIDIQKILKYSNVFIIFIQGYFLKLLLESFTNAKSRAIKVVYIYIILFLSHMIMFPETWGMCKRSGSFRSQICYKGNV